ncbi:hypothetical protein DMN91_000102 [Ooceraea biroi]|uniref:Translation initiation factor eIF2B subunit delta n=1 Tax=Ooceraea biroi TaxID=2015173 RepID=A0A026WEG3_OOCBI|nr:translation initiation factor eIF-2B subunit delta [Ooceraea biroi]EZA54051.1 Translation initiation factor eIF-2B subunit delta [Ooceraea biroi]RLU26308.1 hypothetical protein DMN91_000102 [Ooceraea biroi]
MSSQKPDGKSNLTQKTREEVKAEREAKKAAKAAAKAAKSKTDGANNNSNVTSLTNNKIPEASINCVRTDKAKEKSSKSERIDNVKNKSLKTSNKVSEQIVMDTMDAVNVQGKKVAREVSKQEAVSSSNITQTNEPSEGEKKSKAELRAERRAKQEEQRAVKQQQQQAKSNVQSQPVKQAVKPEETVSECKVKKISATKEDAHKMNLFKHLYDEREQSSKKVQITTINSSIHPAIVRLGVQYASKIVVGSNARCVALLAAVKQVVRDFEKPVQADFVRGLEVTLKESLEYLHHCRPKAVSMDNAMRHLKWQMTQFPSTLSDDEAKNKLQNIIDTYISEQIQLADQAISLTIQRKISDGNVILTYGFSSLICKILIDAHDAGKKFRVIVVDGRPWLEGKELLRRLAKHGIESSYILINALSFVMPEVSKVFLGAHALFANGSIMSRAGTALVALIAKSFNVPVLVACETHKSCERVQTDSIVYNELGEADELVNNRSSSNSRTSVLSNWRTKQSLNLLNITYDVTPADLVTAFVTELGILPCTSVPVILRIKPTEI